MGPAPPSLDPRGLPARWTASHRGGHGRGHEGDLRQYLPRCRPRAEPQQVAQQPRLRRRPQAPRGHGHLIRVASPKLIMEEAPESYKDVTQVVQTCHDAGISKKAVKLKPIAVVKG